MFRRLSILALSLILSGAACAPLNFYQFGAKTLYPADIHTVYVPMFQSESFRRYLGERLTEAVVKEIESTTPFKVVGSPNADSVLTGVILFDTKKPLGLAPTGDVRESQAQLVVQVSWADRRGELIREGAIQAPPSIVTLNESGLLVPEFGASVTTSQQHAIDDLARQIVTLMETPW